jgi:hypothetical protein
MEAAMKATSTTTDSNVLTVVAPPIKDHTKTPRGDEKEWGAAVKTVSTLNRSTLSYAPAMAVQMLQYKAAEAGIRCDVVTDEAPEIAVGSDIVATTKTLRRARRSGDGSVVTS